MTARPASLRPGASSTASGPASGIVSSATGIAISDQRGGELPRRQPGPAADQQRRRGDADALAEDAEDGVEGEGDEEAVGAAVDAEGVR